MDKDEVDFLNESNKQRWKENPEKAATSLKMTLILSDACVPLIRLLTGMQEKLSPELFREQLKIAINGFICTFTANIDDAIQFTEELKAHIIKRANRMSKGGR